ncbi:MAG: YbjQ family protein [Litorimonas sp.]
MMTDIFISLLYSFGPFVALLIIGFGFGTLAQRRHIAQLDRREAALGDFMLTTLEHAQGRHGELVTGSTVVAFDFFRRIAIMLRKIIGGRFHMHEAMMMRARREAMLRMAEDAKAQGAVSVHNIRLMSSNIGNSGSAMGGCEVVAYGTAVWI